MTEEAKKQLNDLLQTIPPTKYGKELQSFVFIRALLRGEAFFHPLLKPMSWQELMTTMMKIYVNTDPSVSEDHSCLYDVLGKLVKILRSEYSLPLKEAPCSMWHYKVYLGAKGNAPHVTAMKYMLDMLLAGRMVLTYGGYPYVYIPKEELIQKLNEHIEVPGADNYFAFSKMTEVLNCKDRIISPNHSYINVCFPTKPTPMSNKDVKNCYHGIPRSDFRKIISGDEKYAQLMKN